MKWDEVLGWGMGAYLITVFFYGVIAIGWYAFHHEAADGAFTVLLIMIITTAALIISGGIGKLLSYPDKKSEVEKE